MNNTTSREFVVSPQISLSFGVDIFYCWSHLRVVFVMYPHGLIERLFGEVDLGVNFVYFPLPLVIGSEWLQKV